MYSQLTDWYMRRTLTEAVFAGNIAKRFPHKTLDWDGPNMTAINHPEVDEWVRRPYRKGWSL